MKNCMPFQIFQKKSIEPTFGLTWYSTVANYCTRQVMHILGQDTCVYRYHSSVNIFIKIISTFTGTNVIVMSRYYDVLMKYWQFGT